MTLGIVMLVHSELRRAEQVACHWAKGGCPVVIHVDKSVKNKVYENFVSKFKDYPNILFCQRYKCEWGSWGLVQASQVAAQLMLQQFAQVQHVYLMSGSCLPLRPVRDLVSYLHEHKDTDFIESVSTTDVPWIVSGLNLERFTLYFPFSWKKQRKIFDRFVELQRKLKIRRKIPQGLEPHMGSQWWCLTRNTLTKILSSPHRRSYDRFFRWVWIPDESYYQTLVRHHSERVESRSLTLSKFDFQGKPHIFYNDHVQLLRRSDCFVARKIWHHADELYREFLTEQTNSSMSKKPNPAKIDLFFSKALDKRTRGRSGLFMQSRFPVNEIENRLEMHPFWVFQGFGDVFQNFEDWLTDTIKINVHGNLFAKDRVHYADGVNTYYGGLTDSAAMRDYHLDAFVSNFLWNTRGERHCFQFSPRDNQKVLPRLIYDQNTRFNVITGAWAINLFRSGEDMQNIKKTAIRLQKNETEQIHMMRSPHVRAQVKIWTLSEFVNEASEVLQKIIDQMRGGRGEYLTDVPQLVDLEGFGRFLQDLKNSGVQTHLMGDFLINEDDIMHPPYYQKPYLVNENEKI